MKKAVLSFLLIVVCPILLFGRSVSLFKEYGIPTYSYHSIKLNSQDFLNYWNYNEPKLNTPREWHFSISLRLDETVVKQTPTKTARTDGIITLDYKQERTDYTGNEKEDSTDLYIEIASNINWYPGDEKGMFLHLGYNVVDIFDFKAKINAQIYGIPAGLGYGRIINVKNVAQAYVISQETGSNLADEMLLQLAQVIEKYNNGYYFAEFRDDSEIQFYKDIAAITGKPEQAMKIKQILDSPLYKTSERYIGWNAKIGIYNYLVIVNDYNQDYWSNSGVTDAEYAGDLFANLEYALPLDFNKQFIAGLSYMKNLDDGDYRHPHYAAYTRFLVDHKFNWASSLNLYYEKVTPKDLESLSNFIFSLRTEYALLNRLTIFSSLNYQSTEFLALTAGELGGVLLPLTLPSTNTDIWGNIYETGRQNYGEFHLGFTYYIK